MPSRFNVSDISFIIIYPFMKNNICQTCLSKKTIKTGNMLFCESCRIYYIIQNNLQRPKILPLKDVNQISFEFCTKCEKNFDQIDCEIRCRNFNEYLSKFMICKKCRIDNRDFISNLYYKNFVFYKKEVVFFGFFLKILFFVLFLFCPVFYVAIFVEYALGELTFSKSILYFLANYFFSSFEVINDLFFFYFFFVKIIMAKKVVFDVPSNLQRYNNLHHFIKRLKISDSFNSNEILS